MNSPELPLGPDAYEQEPCRDCGGSGVDDRDFSDCYTCAGTGLLYTERAISVRVAVDEESSAS